MLSGPEVRERLIKGLAEAKARQPKTVPPEQQHKVKEAAEAIQHMMQSTGWKLVEKWIDAQIEDIAWRTMLDQEPDETRKTVARAYAELLLWVNELAQHKPEPPSEELDSQRQEPRTRGKQDGRRARTK